MEDVDLNDLLARFPEVDLDPRGRICWIVLVDGEQVGWVRETNSGRFSGTVRSELPSGGRYRRRIEPLRQEHFDTFDDAVRYVVAEVKHDG